MHYRLLDWRYMHLIFRLQCLSYRNDAAVEVAQQLLNSSPNITDSWLCVANMWCDMNSFTN